MSFIEGFLGGFADTGSKIMQAQDEREQRIRELVASGDEQIRVNNAKIKADAEQARKDREETLRMNQELIYGSPRAAATPTSSAPILQMAEEPDIMDEEAKAEAVTNLYGAEVPTSSPFTGISATVSPQSIPREYLEMYANDPNMVQKAMAEYKKDSITQARLDNTLNAASTRAEATMKSKEAQIKADRESSVVSSWNSAYIDKNSDLYQTMQDANRFQTTKEQIANYRKASKDKAAKTAIGALVNGFLANGTLDAKLLEEAGISSAVSNAKDLKPVSNDEIRMLKSIAPSPDNVDAYNQYLFTILEYRAARASQKAKFYREAKNKGMSVLDADMAYSEWENDYINKNPYFAQNPKTGVTTFAKGVTPEFIVQDDSWKTQLGMEPTTKRQLEQQTPSTQIQGSDKEKTRLENFLGF